MVDPGNDTQNAVLGELHIQRNGRLCGAFVSGLCLFPCRPIRLQLPHIHISQNGGVAIGEGDLCHRILPIAADSGDGSVFIADGKHSSVGIAVSIRIQKQQIAAVAQLFVGLLENFRILRQTHHIVNARAPRRGLLRNSRIVQAEHGEHTRPIAVRVAVPLSVSGDADFCLAVVGQNVVALTLAATQLGLGDHHNVIRPIAGACRQVSLPNLRRLQIRRGVCIAGNCVDMLLHAAQPRDRIARVRVGMYPCRTGGRCFGRISCRFVGRCFGRLPCRFVAGCFDVIAADQRLFCRALLCVQMLCPPAGCVVGNGDARHTQAPRNAGGNKDRQHSQNRCSAPPAALFIFQL